MVKADLIPTPFADFLMVEISNQKTPVNSPLGYLSGVGVKPRPVNPVKGHYPPSTDYLTKFRDSHPEFPIDGFYMPFVNEVVGRTLSQFDDALIRQLANKANERRKEVGAGQIQYSEFRTDLLINVWLQAIKQQGITALVYNTDHGVIVKRDGNNIKLADNEGTDNNGHGNFEIKTYEIISSTPSPSRSIYPASTLELKLCGSMVGQGTYEFEKRF